MQRLAGLDDDDLAALGRLCEDRRQVRARAELVAQGAQSDTLHILLDGWASRHKLLPDGKRQITAVLVPGDICDLDALHVRRADCAVATLSACTVATVSRSTLRKLAGERRRIADALGWLGAVENAMLAERATCLGRRSAREQLAQFFCELLVRLSVVGRAHAGGFTLPLTQEAIADALGLTAVHVNRTVQALRADRLIEQHGDKVTIPDWNALRQAAGFQPDYLHLEGMDDAGDGLAAPPWASATAPLTSRADG